MSSHPRRRASPEKTRPSVFWPAAAIVVPVTGLIAKIEITGALTRERPKALIEVAGRPLIDHALALYRAAGVAR